MTDDFDARPAPADPIAQGARPVGGPASGQEVPEAPERLPELVAEVYRNAAAPLRTRLLECLLRPVGPLGLVAIAAGAFGAILHRGGYRELNVLPEDAHRISPEHMLELARYLEQAYPESLLQIAPIVADRGAGLAGMAGVAASLLLLALQSWRQRARGS